MNGHPHVPGVRAAVIIEVDDGTRMIYELAGPITFTAEPEYPDTFDWPVRSSTVRNNITVTGQLVRGQTWKDDLPTTAPELGAHQDAIEGTRR